MRNIKRVILWGVPPSFCALVQRCGRAGRDFSVNAEAILIAPANAFTKAATDADIGTAVYAATIAEEASNRNDEDDTILEANGVTVAHGNELVSIEEGGIRISRDLEDDTATDQPSTSSKQPRRKKTPKDFSSREAHYLALYLQGTRCLRAIWNEFFNNTRKCECYNLNRLFYVH